MAKGIGAVQAAAMLLFGVLAGQQFSPSLSLCLGLLGLSLAGGIFFYLRGRKYTLDQPPKKAARIFFCAALFAAGMCRCALNSGERPAGAVENYTDRERVVFTGTVIAPPVTTPSRTTIRVEADSVQEQPDSPDHGKVLLVFYSPQQEEYRYGDRLRVSGKAVLPPDTGGSFSYRTYLERDGITVMINNPSVEKLPGKGGDPVRSAVYRLREVLIRRVFRLFPKPENALMAGILLGDESMITSDIDHAFQQTGTAHIIAISGANFTLLTWLMLSILRRLIRHWWAPVLMLPFIWFYTVLVGGNSAVVRAAVMCSLSIIGMTIGRKGNGINNLALTSAAMVMFRPSYLSDLGFQLSVTATLGILLFSGPLGNGVRLLLSKLFPKMGENTLSNVTAALNDLVILSVSAQIFTVWVSAQAFGRISLISLPANFLIAPFQSLIMLGGFAALILSFIFYPLGAAAAWLVWPAPALTIRIVQRCAEVRGGSVYFDLPPLQAWLVIALILALYLGRHRIVNSIRTRNFRPYLILLLMFTAVMVWVNVLDRLDRRTVIEFTSTASSLTLKVRSPSKRLFIIADGLTNYAARKTLEEQLLPVRRVPAAAWIDFREAWMLREFTGSGPEGDPAVLYLNGRTDAPGLPQTVEPGFVFSADGVTLRAAASFMGKRAWTAEYGGQRVLIPNGIPPERIFTRTGVQPSGTDLVLIGKRDLGASWQEYSAAHDGHPAVLDRTDPGRVTLTVSEGHIGFLNR